MKAAPYWSVILQVTFYSFLLREDMRLRRGSTREPIRPCAGSRKREATNALKAFNVRFLGENARMTTLDDLGSML